MGRSRPRCKLGKGGRNKHKRKGTKSQKHHNGTKMSHSMQNKPTRKEKIIKRFKIIIIIIIIIINQTTEQSKALRQDSDRQVLRFNMVRCSRAKAAGYVKALYERRHSSSCLRTIISKRKRNKTKRTTQNKQRWRF